MIVMAPAVSSSFERDDVVREARDEAADGVGVVEGDRHALQVAEELQCACRSSPSATRSTISSDWHVAEDEEQHEHERCRAPTIHQRSSVVPSRRRGRSPAARAAAATSVQARRREQAARGRATTRHAYGRMYGMQPADEARVVRLADDIVFFVVAGDGHRLSLLRVAVVARAAARGAGGGRAARRRRRARRARRACRARRCGRPRGR